MHQGVRDPQVRKVVKEEVDHKVLKGVLEEQDQRVHKEHRVLRVLLEQPELQVNQVQQAHKVPLGRKVLKVPKVLQVLLVLLAPQDRLVSRETLERQVVKVLREPKVHHQIKDSKIIL